VNKKSSKVLMREYINEIDLPSSASDKNLRISCQDLQCLQHKTKPSAKKFARSYCKGLREAPQRSSIEGKQAHREDGLDWG